METEDEVCAHMYRVLRCDMCTYALIDENLFVNMILVVMYRVLRCDMYVLHS